MQTSPHDLMAEKAHLMRLAKIVKKYPRDENARAELNDSRARFAQMKIDNYVQKVVDKLPPLTPEQREQFGRMLSSNPVYGAGAETVEAGAR